MRNQKKYALSNACYWLNRCYDFGLSAVEVVALSLEGRSVTSQSVTSQLVTRRLVAESEEAVKGENFPPLPPKESKKDESQPVTSQMVTSQSVTRRLVNKENEGKRENFPPAPPIESKGKQEKAAAAAAARVCVSECARDGRPTLEKVEQFADLVGIDQQFAKSWFYWCETILRWRHPKDNKPIHAWQRYLQLCWKCRNEFDPLPPAPEPEKEKVKKYTARDWILCAERCKFFDKAKCECMRGYLVPPEKLEYPRPPEQCADFARLPNPES